ncbi:MAG: VanW family protein, partial [Lachnospiraceae bacterium]|nr:VanW family protein [Lachnospiraceae bacterium]
RTGISLLAAASLFVCSSALDVSAQETATAANAGLEEGAQIGQLQAGVPYVSTIAALRADTPGQKLVVKAQGYTFEKTMAELGGICVIVQDNGDGTRLCHIPDTSILDAFTAEINTALAGAPESDAFYYYDGATNTFQTYPAVSYQQINEAGREVIYHKLLEALAGTGAEDKTAELDAACFATVSADVPDEVAVNRYSLEGSCTTSFKGSSSSRIGNIQVAAGNINQMILMPGCEVSMNAAFLPRTSANGYKPAGTYYDGRVVPGMGGGICQVSSTVYNAAMNAGLTVLERHPHSMPVHYLPLGMDAAISSGSKDLRLRNDYPFPVLFEAYTEGKNLTVNIYTNELLTAGVSYRLHAVRKGSLTADTYLEVSANGVVTEDRFIGTSRYNPMKEEEDGEED